MNRRQFLAAASTGALLGVSPLRGADAAATAATTRAFSLDSPPVLQNPTPTGVTVAWAVNGPSTGWVEYGPTKDLGNVAKRSTTGLIALEERFLSVPITGLTPGEPIYYKVVSTPINFAGAYKISRGGEPLASPIYRYSPPTPSAATATFAVLNDTHENEQTLKALTSALAAEPADYTIYNGDVFNDIRTDDQIVKMVLRPAGAAYAAERPVLFAPGNHDHRGVAARGLARAFTRYADQPSAPWNFAVRHGPIALVGLDTGEDKPDHHPNWAGLAAFEPYRVAQRDWLAATLKRPDIASAPFLVVFCHIPLWGLPGDNPGDTLEGYASYCRHAQRLWHPLLAEAKPHLTISGHTHRHRYDAPNDDRNYGQLVGGDPKLEQATLIRGKAENGKLTVKASNLKGDTLGEWSYEPRKV